MFTTSSCTVNVTAGIAITSRNQPTMTLQQLRDFIAVIEHGGFRSAARGLGVSQGGLTKSIAKLEQEYGVAIIDRQAKGLSLTPDGQAFLSLSRATVAEADRAARWLAQAGTKASPSISLGVSIDPSLYLAPAVLADFRRTHPNVALHIHQSASTDLLRQLRDNCLDVAVIRLPRDFSASDLDTRVIYDGRTAIIARAGHPAAAATSVHALMACDWVIVGDALNPNVQDASLIELFDEAGLGRPRIAACTSSLFDAVSVLMQSDCVARLPASVLAHSLLRGKLVAIPVQEGQGRYDIAIVCKESRHQSAEVRRLCAMLISYARAGARAGAQVAATA